MRMPVRNRRDRRRDELLTLTASLAARSTWKRALVRRHDQVIFVLGLAGRQGTATRRATRTPLRAAGDGAFHSVSLSRSASVKVSQPIFVAPVSSSFFFCTSDSASESGQLAIALMLDAKPDLE